MFQQRLNSILLLGAITLSSCGYVSDKPLVDGDLYKSKELQSCKVDATKLSEIFASNQEDQIRCLKENFIQFTKYVRSKNPDSVSEGELNTFVRKFFEGQSETIVKGLSVIFQLNMLLLKDEADRISKNNISPLFELLVKVNQEAIKITEVLKEIDDEKNQSRFWELKDKFNKSVRSFSDFTISIIEKSPGLQKKLNIKTFILEASAKLSSKEFNPETVESLLFLKKVIAGGDKEVITSEELKIILQRLPKILSMSFDLFYIRNSNFANDRDHSRYHLQNLIDLYSLIDFKQNDFSLFTIDQVLSLVETVIKNANAKKFKPSLMALKARLIDRDKSLLLKRELTPKEIEAFTLRDLNVVLDMVRDGLERNYFNLVTYNAFQSTLEETRPIFTLPLLKLPKEYDLFTEKQILEFHSDFVDVAANIRYFRSEKEGIPFYGTEIKRNKQGFMEATYMKWASVKLLKAYGHKNKEGRTQVNEKEFGTFLNDMKPILEEYQLWSPTPETFARNSILLADLFQNKSNGDLEVNVTEATEYIQMILSAVQITDKFREKLTIACDPGMNTKDPVFGTECFNENFFPTILDDLNYKKFFPRLNAYIANSPKEEVNDFLVGVEGFARDSNDPNLPINKRDNILILGAMLNIESTFIRFDLNRDNLIDYPELVEAFKVYKPAIIALAKLDKSREPYALSIFLYMVSKMEIPPTGNWLDDLNFGAFHYCLTYETFCPVNLKDKITAKRLNIGKLLYYMVNQPIVADKGKERLLPKNE